MSKTVTSMCERNSGELVELVATERLLLLVSSRPPRDDLGALARLGVVITPDLGVEHCALFAARVRRLA